MRTEETQSVVLWLIPSAATIFTAAKAYMSGLPWHLIMFYGSGVFAFVAASIYFLSERQIRSTVKGRIALIGFQVKQIYKVENSYGHVVVPQFNLKSHADKEIYFKIKRMDVSLDGKVNQEKFINPISFLMQPKSDQCVYASGIPNIELKEHILGKLDMEILYGSSKEYMPFLWEYRGTLELIMIPESDKQGKSTSRCIDEYSDHRLA